VRIRRRNDLRRRRNQLELEEQRRTRGFEKSPSTNGQMARRPNRPFFPPPTKAVDARKRSDDAVAGPSGIQHVVQIHHPPPVRPPPPQPQLQARRDPLQGANEAWKAAAGKFKLL